MIYKFRTGSPLKGDAQVVGDKLESIRQQRGGILHPKDVVAEAENDNVLNPYFEWDNDRAAERYRLAQAGNLIRSVVAVFESEDDTEPKVTRAFVSVISAGHHYTNVLVAMSDETMRTQVLHKAMKELESFRKKYQDLEDLAPVFAAMDTVAA